MSKPAKVVEFFSDHPRPPMPLRSWPWGAWTGKQRAWVILKTVLGVVVTVAGAISAFVLILGVGPLAYQTVFWRDVEYRTIGDLGLGNSRDYLESKLGPPAYFKQLYSTPRFTQEIYLRRDYMIMTVSNAGGESVLFSVLSCDPRFAPKVINPLGRLMQLQSVPISSAEATFVVDGSKIDPNKDRGIVAVPPVSVSSPDGLIEADPSNGSMATKARSYFIGVSGICVDTTKLGDRATLEFNGSIDDAPAELRHLRTTLGANFYAESSLGGSLADDGTLMLDPQVVDGVRNVQISLTPHQFDLPRSRIRSDGTRRFG